MTQDYTPQDFESRWQDRWVAERTFAAKNPGSPGFDPNQPKYYVLDMFPYPSGSGLHVGHGVGYVGSDVVARRKRMEGFNVLHPMGWDAFGLPAEQYAIKTGQHPKETTRENVDNYRSQLRKIGLSYDWEREVNTSDPSYYRWTQWIFKRLFEKGLAYRTEAAVWWCEDLKTVLANEEVINGRSERGNHPCVRRPLKQWMLKITAYADRLLEDLDLLDWPESVKTMQREWIGRSEGGQIRFPVEGLPGSKVEVFTTRPDTLWGATFMVVAPEHPLLGDLTTDGQRGEVEAYVAAASAKSELDRTDLAKDKTGVFTGSYGLNPLMDPGAEGARVPIYVADYVLASYGTGAIMGVPGGDERDREFAQVYGLPVIEVVTPPEGVDGLAQGVCYTGEGTAVNSGPLDGLSTPEAKAKVIELLEAGGHGEGKVTYRLRDWLFSRQRYWGEPFPLLHLEDGTTVAVEDGDLPVELPPMDDFTPSEDGSAPLGRAKDWLATEAPEGGPATRDTDTMPGWAGSCWYWLRFMDPTNESAPFSSESEGYWGPVDLYIGGASHAVMHLLYARFWHKVLYDLGVVSSKEPFQRLFNQGMITAFAYKDKTDRNVDMSEVEPKGSGFVRKGTDEPIEQFVTKMAKSLGNVVNPDDIVAEFGSDTLRLYELFMGPLADAKPWNPRDIAGCRRFLERAWRVFVDPEGDGKVRPNLSAETTGGPEGGALELEKALHRTLKRVDDSFEHFNFNTAIAAMMSLLNEIGNRAGELRRDQGERFLAMLAPFAPHMAEELWERLGHQGGIAHVTWPKVDPEMLVDESYELVVQVQGKLRAKAKVATDASKDQLEAAGREAVSEWLEGQQVVKAIVVPGKLVNFVVRPA